MSAMPENKEHYAEESKNISTSGSASILSPHSEEITAEESARVVRKIDWHVMPLMCLVYGIQFVSIPYHSLNTSQLSPF
jgi:ACS family allantoate permease-like MFS transporter